MNKPTITINGKEIEMREPKACIWRRAVQLSEKRNEIAAVDFVDSHCEFIADAFGISADDVLENIDVADVMPIFYDVLAYVMNRLWTKIINNKKNETADVETQI